MADERAALLIIDVQNDFCPGGALAVEEGDQVVSLLNAYAERFRARNLPVYASRDWHPARTKHFKEFGGLWPPHCVQGSPGAAFHPQLKVPAETDIVTAGDDPETDGYSVFEGHMQDGTSLEDRLKQDGVTHLYLGGLATDYCVRASALDARKVGLEVTLLIDAVRAVEVNLGDGDRAIAEMRAAGVDSTTLDEFELR